MSKESWTRTGLCNTFSARRCLFKILPEPRLTNSERNMMSSTDLSYHSLPTMLMSSLAAFSFSFHAFKEDSKLSFMIETILFYIGLVVEIFGKVRHYFNPNK